MSRFTSLRSFWTTARSGILCSMIVVLGCLTVPVLAQDKPDFAAMDEGMGGYYDEPSDMMGSNQQQAKTVLANVASPLSRPDNYSSLNAVQALLYSDAVSVVHLNVTKIDYEGLSAFLDEIVDKGAGSIQSDDNYRVNLREYQKKAVKESFKNLLSTLQNLVVKLDFENNIDEIYTIKYASNDPKVLGATIAAIPTAGMKDDDVRKTIDHIDAQGKALAVFIRYGFIIAVLEHDAATPFDTTEIDSRYQAKALQSQNRGSYGSYGSSNNAGYNGMGASGMNQRGNSMGAANNAQLLREYQTEIDEAKQKNKRVSRQEVLPRLRNRFSAPATAQDAAPFMKGLALTDGAAYAMTTKNLDDILASLNLDNQDADSPFAGLGAPKASKKSSDSNSLFASIQETVEDQTADANANAVTIAISLVGSPRLVAFFGFANEDEAKSSAKLFETTLAAVKPMVLKSMQDAVVEAGGDLDKANFAPLVNGIFEELKPRVSGSNLAIVLSLEAVRANAAVFMPLLGGVESKSKQQMESESIDWSLGEEKKSAASDDDDDLFGDEDEETKADADEADDKDAASEGDDDEEDPFA